MIYEKYFFGNYNFKKFCYVLLICRLSARAIANALRSLTRDLHPGPAPFVAVSKKWQALFINTS